MSLYTFNFTEIKKQLNAPEPDVPAQWLEESYRDPERFWEALFNFFSGQFSPLPKSRPGQGYDFYNDLVVRNLQKDRIAWRWFDDEESNEWQELTFAGLHLLAYDKACQWLAQGVKQGDII